MKQYNFTSYVNKALSIVLTIFLLWMVKTYLSPFLLSLLLAFLLSAVSEAFIRPLCRKGLSRSRSAMLVVPLLLLLIISFLILAIIVLGSQLEDLLTQGNHAAKELSSVLIRVQEQLQNTRLGHLSVWQYLERWLENLDLNPLVKNLTALAAGMPGLLLGLTFVLLGGYQLAAHRTEIFPFIGRQLSPRTAAMILQLKDFLQHTVLHWLKAQLILFLITFGMLSLGLWLLKIPSWLLISLVTSLLDALPVIGAGMILLPWALICGLTGNITLALELAAIYAIMEIVRNLLEPRILSAQLGLPPFVTLCSLYLGFTLMGIGGMLFFPLVALSLIKLQEWGYLKRWK